MSVATAGLLTATERIAKIERTFLGYEDHGILTAILHCSYGTTSQGIGLYALDAYDEVTKGRKPTTDCGRFVQGILQACGTDSWEKVKGRTIIVMFDSDDWNARPIGIRPLPTEDGKPFYFKEGTDDEGA
jgi:hypothetical protein